MTKEEFVERFLRAQAERKKKAEAEFKAYRYDAIQRMRGRKCPRKRYKIYEN